MFTRQEAIEFAKASADMAFDQRNASEYSATWTAFDSYRDNVRDTLNDERSAQYEAEAFEVYDARYAALQKA